MIPILIATLSGSAIGASPSMQLSCETCVTFEVLLAQAEVPGARAEELRREIALLDDKIGAIDVAWPTGALVMATAGYITSPLILLGLPLMIAGALIRVDSTGGGSGVSGLLIAGGVLTSIGVLGLVLMIKGIIDGVSATRELKQEKDALRERRRSLRLELASLGASARLEGPPVLPLAGLRF